MTNKRRRGQGEGSMREVRPGVWQLRVSAGTHPVTGKHRIVASTHRGTKTAAARALAELVAAEHPITQELTVAELLEAWLETASLSATSTLTYRAALKHLPTAWAARRADQIRTSDVARLVHALNESGVGPSQVRKLHAGLSAAFTQAVRWDMLPRNPARGVELPPVGREPSPPSEEQISALFAAAADDLQETVFLTVAVITGMRRGELCALRWSHLDLDGARVQVAENVTVLGETKGTKTGRTDWLALDDNTVILLRRWRKAQIERALATGIPYSTDPFVLSDALDSGRGWLPNLAGTRFRQIRARAHVTGVRLHDLRHATATYLLDAGADIRTVTTHMRHARASTTLNIYAGVLAGRDRTAANILGQLVTRTTTTPAAGEQYSGSAG